MEQNKASSPTTKNCLKKNCIQAKYYEYYAFIANLIKSLL